MKPIFVEFPIKTTLEDIWEHTQNPVHHVRWDLRFSNIDYKERENEDDPVRFSYVTRLGFGLKIEGVGVSKGVKEGRYSALQFSTDDWKSLIVEGEGSWVYLPHQEGILFRTVYDYHPRYGVMGRVIDSLMFRPLMRWATAWSFDRLRLWLEKGILPELSFILWMISIISKTALGFVWIWEGLVPKILFPSPEEIEMVNRTGLAWWEASSFIPFLGVWEILLGLALIAGVFPRLTAGVSLVLLLFFSLVVPWVEPELLYNPFGAITKNAGLIACSIVVLLIQKWIPSAKRCNLKLRGRANAS
ncbi:DoxX-like family protein [Effusibacillus consociatus]|uniref:DoxX-like family protein n=1 Tax=Effusibacillus consociatus TaxID=1117041 RepID=A0ABV9PV08_9BACL